MTWRAFFIGILGVLGLALLTPVNDYAIGNTYLTGNHFPVGVFFFLLFLALVVNVAVKLVRSAWALRRSELMLVLCMMLVSATVPASGLMRYFFPLTASAPYLAQRPDYYWEDTVLEAAPEGILLSRDMRSVPVRQFFEGTPRDEPVRVPWRQWSRVIATWAGFIALYYVATFLLMGILRRQWVENERLTFPIARFPLELTAEAQGGGLLPRIFAERAFLLGAGAALVAGLIRLMPLFTGAQQGWLWQMPVSQFIEGTPLEQMPLGDGRIFLIAIAMAFLVGNEVSLSMWLFYVLTCIEELLFHSLNIPVAGGPHRFVVWQQAGAFIAFTLGLLWLARRHLWGVVRSAVGRGGVDDSGEPIPYRLGFWGLIACAAAMLYWYARLGISLSVGALLLLLIATLVIVHARLVTQGGLILTGQSWTPPEILHGVLGGRAFSAPAVVLVQVQHAILTADCREILSPHAMNSLRIAGVFEKHRRWFLPAMLAALVVALLAAGYSTLTWVYYRHGAANLPNTYAISWHSLFCFGRAHDMISNPSASAEPHLVALVVGAGLVWALQLLRGAFYWWPLNPLGLLVSASWAIRPLWFSFLLGWAIKGAILRFGSGRTLRGGRLFFLGVIAAEVALIGLCTFYSLLTGFRIGYLFLPS